MAATGLIVEGPLAAAALVNAAALPSARMAYELMSQILGENQAPLILASLPLSAAAIGEGLLAYEASLAAGQAAQLEG
jgi:hypothetical protein